MNPISVATNTTVATIPEVTPSAAFNMEQIHQINSFFSSTPGVIAFSLTWLICIVGILCFTGYMLAKSEEEERTNPVLTRKKERQELMLLGRNPESHPEIELPTICTNEEDGNYHRLL
ncbi:unnamed protein product [Caenorhabditis brenneri]